MKTLMTIILALTIIFFAVDTTTAQEFQKNTRVGIVGNVWHPVGIFASHHFSNAGFGIYGTAKSNFEVHQNPMMNQYNFTAGVSTKIFTNTASSMATDLLVGISYNTDPDNESYNNIDETWGAEVLLLLPLPDKNFRFILGWSSNANEALEGVTAGLVVQF